MRDIDEHARERALAQLVAVGRDGYSRFGRGVILVEAAHQRAVRYLARVAFEAELVERFGLTLDHDADTRRLAELLDTYDPDTQVLSVEIGDQGGLKTFVYSAPIDAAQAAPVFRADVRTEYVGPLDRIPALAEAGALGTIGALGWKGYQKYGRGVVIYLPTEGNLHFASARDYGAHMREAMRKAPVRGADTTSIATEALRTYDPFSEVLLLTRIRLPEDTGEWLVTTLKPPKPPQHCKATWRLLSRADTV